MNECPKCGFDQVQSGECAWCGIIIAKYRERNPAGGAVPSEAHRPPDDGPDEKGRGRRPAPPGRQPYDHTENAYSQWWEKGKALWHHLSGRFAPEKGHGSRIGDAAFHGLLILVITLIAYTGLLYALRVTWIFYTATPVGEQFVGGFTRKAEGIVHLLDQVSPVFALEVTITAFVICLAVGAGCRFLHITSSIYVSIGFLGRILLCGIPLAAIVASCLQPRYGFEVWSVAYAAALVPTLCLYHVCFGIASALLPEIGGLWDRAAPLRAMAARKTIQWIRKSDRKN